MEGDRERAPLAGAYSEDLAQFQAGPSVPLSGTPASFDSATHLKQRRSVFSCCNSIVGSGSGSIVAPPAPAAPLAPLVGASAQAPDAADKSSKHATKKGNTGSRRILLPYAPIRLTALRWKVVSPYMSTTTSTHSRLKPLLAALAILVAAVSWPAFAEPPILPNPDLTPGNTFPVSRNDVCVPGYAHKVRDVPWDEKREVFRRYGVPLAEHREYEVDHLIPLCLGGSNSIRNLWPQSRTTQPWNAYRKDKLEYHLWKLVCDGQADLADAQRQIASNWIDAYKKYMGEPTAQDQSLRSILLRQFQGYFGR